MAMITNWLFVCSRNRLRSPTAEKSFERIPGLAAMSAGTAADADEPVTPELIDWADAIFVMEAVHRKKITDRFKANLKGKRIVVLGVPDEFEYMQPELVELLNEKMEPYIRILPMAK